MPSSSLDKVRNRECNNTNNKSGRRPISKLPELPKGSLNEMVLKDMVISPPPPPSATLIEIMQATRGEMGIRSEQQGAGHLFPWASWDTFDVISSIAP